MFTIDQSRMSSKHCFSLSGLFACLFITLILITEALAQTAPPVPISRQDRFGSYFWDPDYYGLPTGMTRMAWGSDLVAQTGSRTIRVFIGDPTYACASNTLGPYVVSSYPSADTSDYLLQIALNPEYTSLFLDNHFSTYLLTTYTPGATSLNWLDGFDDTEYEYERVRIYNLAMFLKTFNKRFILLNWEGDHAFTFQQTATSRDGYVRWIKAMAEGIQNARADSPQSPGSIYSGLEFICVSNTGHPDCIPGSNTPLVVNYVAPRVKVDYLSYSAWNTTTSVPVTGLTTAIQNDVTSIINSANNRNTPDGVSYDKRNIILGEFGFDQNAAGAPTTAASVTEMFNAAETAGVAYALFWQVLNNLGGNCQRVSPLPNFGLYTPTSASSVALTAAGQAFKDSIMADTVWVDDTLPAGAITEAHNGDSWNWISTNPSPVSGALVHQSNIAPADHQHFFYNATNTLTVAATDALYAFVFIDPSNPPSEVMLQWNDGTWEHRAYWGANIINWGTDGTDSRRYMGPLPTVGKWVRLSVPANLVGLAGKTLNGMAFTLYGGRATWDRAGKLATTPSCGTLQIAQSSQDFLVSGGGGSIGIIASPVCNWTASTNDAWITITNASGAGNGTLTYSVAANANATLRRGTITIEGKVFTVTQAGTGLQFYPLATPFRLLDTRPGQPACDMPGAPLAAGSTLTQTIAGRTCFGVTIPSNAAAVTGNITNVNSGAVGFITLYPSSSDKPTAAGTNWGPNEIINNVFTVGVGASDGAFKAFTLSTTDLVIDITGYYAPPTQGGLYFHPLPKPIRLLETRANQPGCTLPGTPLLGGVEAVQSAHITCDGITIPSTAKAIVGNATTVNPNGNGYLTLFPADVPRPYIASSNFLTEQIRNAPFTVGLSLSGQFRIYPLVQTDLVIDVLGYYSTEAFDINGAGLLFNPLPAPVRLLETRVGFSGCYVTNAPLLAGSTRTQPVHGTCNGLIVPSSAAGVLGNATVVNPAAGWLTFWPSSAPKPTVAASNFVAGQTFNRHFIVGLGVSDGAFKIFNSSQTDLVIDLTGYFAP